MNEKTGLADFALQIWKLTWGSEDGKYHLYKKENNALTKKAVCLNPPMQKFTGDRKNLTPP
jgi:hypothetical protein